MKDDKLESVAATPGLEKKRQFVEPDTKDFNPTSTKKRKVKKRNKVQMKDLVLGKGPIAAKGKYVKMLYQGFLMDGTQFDECQSRKKPLKFRLGTGQCIPGFDIGVEGMRVGGKRSIVIPPKLGYGTRGDPPTIPGNAELRFEIELVGVVLQ